MWTEVNKALLLVKSFVKVQAYILDNFFSQFLVLFKGRNHLNIDEYQASLYIDK